MNVWILTLLFIAFLEAKATKAEAPELYKHARDIAARLDYARYQLEQSTTMDEINAMAALITDIMTQIMDLKVQIDEFEVAVSFTDTTVEGVEMTLKVNEENKTAEVIRLGNFEANSTVTIPESVNGYTVIGFGDVFSETAVGTVVLPQTIKSIVRYAFNGCRILTSVNIPSLVPTIEFGAFQNCDNLGSIEIPSSVTEIGVDAFYGCSNLVSVNIPNSVTAIGAGAFHRCVKLKSIEIPNSVTAIKDDTFWY